MLLRTEDSLWCRKFPLVNVWQLAVVPVPVSTSKEPVLGAGVRVLALLKPPENAAETCWHPVFAPLSNPHDSIESKHREK